MDRKEKTALFILTIAEHLKPLNTPDDLVRLGIARSIKTLANNRSTGEGPAFIKISGGGIRYEKSSVIAWLEQSAIMVEPENQRAARQTAAAARERKKGGEAQVRPAGQ